METVMRAQMLAAMQVRIDVTSRRPHPNFQSLCSELFGILHIHTAGSLHMPVFLAREMPDATWIPLKNVSYAIMHAGDLDVQ